MNIPSSRKPGSPRAYGAYGEGRTLDLARTAYAGEVLEHGSGWYLLGERPYAPLQRRFLGADGMSPFDGGGLNRYAYCAGDPINRIDPSGRIPTRWSSRQSPLRFPTAGGSQTSSMGANNAAGTSGSASTPSTIAQTAASIIDLTAAAAIPSGSLEPAGPPGNIALGQLARTSNDTARRVPASQMRILESAEYIGRMPTISHERPPGKSRRCITQVALESLPDDMTWTDRHQSLRPVIGWLGLPHRKNPKSTIWAADTEISVSDLNPLFAELNRRGIKKANLHTGAHGAANGRNWSRRRGLRRGLDSKSYETDATWTKRLASDSYDLDLDVYDAMVTDRKGFGQDLKQDGVHIIAYCYGAADREVMKALRIRQLTVYTSPPHSRPST
ncbi:RHS repeat-associated core domain-containing protein [Luteibacter sp. UNCMF366Tsu5.1]|uniref:RHS repeat-associated core domain-containing protein n=1 Tax=Luteibacter sp. UNCMF366Tsu5.1 TaxID=1502758 RepID=UPI000908C079|nr:RHS repeat-associated core domain-containing protein [Luteibacter sp. UNCMF366Tsu5.1]SFW34704.1 RHS repeat-associated core domain-containing protein [Luteibacter sp. UNCMF366Tsu5.1]